MTETWAAADTYEPYVGRWSRLIAREFLVWLGASPRLAWLDVGCGTGALSHSILASYAPRVVAAIDRSREYVAAARAWQGGVGSSYFIVADACNLPVNDGRFDMAVSGLVLNFVSEPARMVAEMMRALRPNGRLALYVWDYAECMELVRYFWDAAVELAPSASKLDEGRRFPVCRPEPLHALFESNGLRDVEVRAIDVPTVFRDFEDYWSPFMGGQGPAPGYAVSLSEEERTQLRQLLRARLPQAPDGSISLVARAWAIVGNRTEHAARSDHDNSDG
ncbi:MAG: class I SAM-dependent methyltransferase [Longimicrobiales bacterium]